MKRLLAWIIASATFLPSALASQYNHWEQWESAYNNALRINESNALLMLQDRYNALPANIEKLYVSSKMHGFMTLRGQPYYGNELANNPEYSKLEQSFIAALNAELELNFSDARSAYLSLLKFANTTSNIQGKILFEYHLCRAMNMQGQFYSAQLYCNALKTHLEDVDVSILPKYLALRVIANNLEFIGDYQASLETYQKYLATIPSYVDPSGVYNDAGLLLKNLGQYELAQEYLTISIRLRKSLNAPLKLAQSHHSMADLLLEIKDYEGAIQHLNLSKAILDDVGHVYGLTHVTLSLGKAYRFLKQYELSKHFLSQSRDYAELQGNDQIRGEIYLALSALEQSQANDFSALEYSREAYALGVKIHSERLQALALKSLAHIAEARGDYELALQHYQDYFDSELSKRTQKNRTAFLALELARREFAQKVQTNQTLARLESLETQLNKLSTQRQILLLSIVLLIITLIGQLIHTRMKSRRAEMDQLTGSLNRAAAIKKIRAIDKTAAQIQKHVLILLDLDDFKNINDSYGHPTGDRALSTIAKGISETIKPDDLFGRLGGEEFIVVLKNVDELDVREQVEQLHNSIANNIFEAENKEKLYVTASFSYLATSKPLNDFDELYSILDQALYQVKQNGKNQIIDAYNEPIFLPNSAYVPVQP